MTKYEKGKGQLWNYMQKLIHEGSRYVEGSIVYFGTGDAWVLS